jgi:hypothetical protein
MGAAMKVGGWACLLLAAAPFVAGCGDFWQPPNKTKTTTCTTNCSASSGDFYLLNAGATPQIVGESIVSGTLTALSGSPTDLSTGVIPTAMAIAPNGNFLVVSTSGGIISYPISSGALGTVVSVDQDLAAAVQVDSTSSWLIEAIPSLSGGGVTLAAVALNSSTGAPISTVGSAPSASFTVANATVEEMVISPDNSNIFVALGEGGTIVVPFNASSAASPFGSKPTAATIPVLHGGQSLSVAVDPSSRLFYIGETLAVSGSGGLRAFTYASLSASSLVNATGSPIASGGMQPKFILPVSSPDYVYVANGTGASTAGNITGFEVTASGSSYSLTTGSSATVGVLPLGLAYDSTGDLLLEAGSNSPYFASFNFDSTTTGQLDPQLTSTSSATYIAIVEAQ